MEEVLKIFRMLASEFANKTDEDVLAWINITAPLINKKVFGKTYEQALALLTAHRIKVSTDTQEALEAVGGLDTAFKISSMATGGENISFNSNTLTTRVHQDAEYTQTSYGIQFLSIKNSHKIGITTSGGEYGRI